MAKIPLILASASESRLRLLKSIAILPDQVFSTEIDETPLQNELPNKLALRLAIAKAHKASESFSNSFIIAADTVSACGRRILEKAETDADVANCLKLLSGRRHKVYSGVCVIKTNNGQIEKISKRLVESTIKFKRLEETEITQYVESKQGIGKGGGCDIIGLMATFITWMSGSHSNIVGLPLYEVNLMLKGLGYKKED